MSPRIAARQREKYVQERRKQILDAAVEIFAQRGFAGANVADIARSVGISKGTIYLYFNSKEEIFTTILAERSFITQLANLIQADQPPEVTLRAVAESYFQYLETSLSVFRLVIADAAHFPAHARQVYAQFVLKSSQVLANFLDQQSKAGQLRPLADSSLTAEAFLGLLFVYTLSQEILDGKNVTPIARENWIREILRLFMESVKPLAGKKITVSKRSKRRRKVDR